MHTVQGVLGLAALVFLYAHPAVLLTPWYRLLFVLCASLASLSLRFIRGSPLPSLVFSTVTSIGLFHLGIVLLGAPLVDAWENTGVLAALLGSLAGQAIFDEIRGKRGRASAKDVAVADPVSGTTILGAWLSTAVIPLDWDVPYQVYPIPLIIGAICGFTLGNFAALFTNSRKQRKE